MPGARGSPAPERADQRASNAPAPAAKAAEPTRRPDRSKTAIGPAWGVALEKLTVPPAGTGLGPNRSARPADGGATARVTSGRDAYTVPPSTVSCGAGPPS